MVTSQTGLQQPVLSRYPEPGHDGTVLTLSNFIQLLQLEEKYFSEDQKDVGRTITRLRKIFYDKFGWDTSLIRGAARIEGRYDTQMGPCGNLSELPFLTMKTLKRQPESGQSLCRRVTYKPTDRVYPEKAGQVPNIYADDHADVLLPDGYHCDIGHVLAGMDALQYPDIVTPLEDPWRAFYKLGPYASSNADVVTWLGDMATSAASFLFHYIKHDLPPTEEVMQSHINTNASASDMSGNIDSYIMHELYKRNEFKNLPVSQMLTIYYNGRIPDVQPKDRFKIFAGYLNLGELKNDVFANEDKFIEQYLLELRATVSFMIFHFVGNPSERYRLCWDVWRGNYSNIIIVEELLIIFLNAIKENY